MTEELSVYLGVGVVVILIIIILMFVLYIATAINVSKIAKIQEENNKMIFEILKLLTSQKY